MAAITSLYFAVFAASFALLAASVSSLPPKVFNVGDERGWTAVKGNGTESYNHWAKRNRFQVGDVLEFKYANDSVLLVSHDDYKQCSTETPLSRFTDGDTKFTFDHFGPFYFVSGVPGHCEAGQRMIVRVVASSRQAGVPAGAPGMPPTIVGAPSPASSSPSSPPGVSAPPLSGSSSSASTSSTPSPSPEAEASGAPSRRVRTVVSSILLGLLVVDVVSSLFVLV